MKVNVYYTPANLDELYFTGKTTVVIDVLRASTTIITALKNGAREVVPVATVEFAMKVSGGMFGGHTLLGGERNTKKIEGFALGNSPLEYTKEIVEGKSIVFFSTNGSKAIVKAKFSEQLFISSFINLNVIAQKLLGNGKDVEILCAGKSGMFSLEDVICAGRLISEMQNSSDKLELSDSAKASEALNRTMGKNIIKLLENSEHGRLLIENGFEEDLDYCSKLNSVDVVPVYMGNALKLSPLAERKNGSNK